MKQAFFLLALTITASAFGETIILRNGQYIKGQLISQTADSVTLKVQNDLQTIPKDRIRRILHVTVSAEQQKQLEAEARAEAYAREKERMEREQWFAARQREQELEMARMRQVEADRRKEETVKPTQSQSEPVISGIFTGGNFSSAWRSALVPGWGQFYQGRPTIGVVYGGAALGAMAMSIYSYDNYRKNYREYKTAVAFQFSTFVVSDSAFPAAAAYSYSRTTAARRAMKRSGFRTDSLLNALALLWIWNVGDAVIFRPSDHPKFSSVSSNDLYVGSVKHF